MHSRISLGQLILLGWREGCRLCFHLGAHLKAKANLMTSRIDIARVDEGGEGDGDTVPQLLLVAQAELRLVVDLGPEAGSSLKVILATNAE